MQISDAPASTAALLQVPHCRAQDRITSCCSGVHSFTAGAAAAAATVHRHKCTKTISEERIEGRECVPAAAAAAVQVRSVATLPSGSSQSPRMSCTVTVLQMEQSDAEIIHKASQNRDRSEQRTGAQRKRSHHRCTNPSQPAEAASTSGEAVPLPDRKFSQCTPLRSRVHLRHTRPRLCQSPVGRRHRSQIRSAR